MTRADLSPEQESALQAILNGENVFLTGPAGTGKSAVIHLAQQYLEEMGRSCLLTATTGIAANQLSGITLHRAMGLGTHLVKNGHLTKASISLLQKADVLFVDEVSMGSRHLFSILYQAVSLCMQKGHQVQVVAVGDFYQLGPVLTKRELPIYKELPGFDQYHIYAFEAEHWKDFHFRMAILTKPFRQASRLFFESLSKIREGLFEGISLLYRCGLSTAPIKDAPWITSKKEVAEAINSQMLEKFTGTDHFLTATVVGVFPEEDRPVPGTLRLKEGIPVVIVANSSSGRYVNGSRGIITKITRTKVKVALFGGKEVDVKPHVWKCQGDQAEAQYHQFPLLPAFAMTIHRVQGMTLEAANIIPYAWAHGQLYTALSRVKDPSRLYIEGKVMKQYLVCDRTVAEWYRTEGYTLQEETVQRIDSAHLYRLPSAAERNGMRFTCHTHHFKIGDTMASHTFLCLSNASGDIVKVTDFSFYLYPKSSLGSRSITADNPARCYFVKNFLNRVFFELPDPIHSISELTLEMGAEFIQAYAMGAIGNGRKTKGTVDKCANAISDFMECLAEDPSLKLMYSKEALYMKSYQHSHARKGLRATSRTFFTKTLTRGFIYDCEEHVINRNLPEPVLRLLLSRIWTSYPEILMNVCLGLTAGLRPSETCAANWKMIRIRWVGGMIQSVTIDLRRELCIREDGVSTGKIKKERIAKVQAPFIDIFRCCYQRYTNLLQISHPEGQDIPIGRNRNGDAIIYQSYYERFKEAVQQVVLELLDDPDPVMRSYGETIQEDGIAPHIFRHQFTLFLVLCGWGAVEIMGARGDSQVESASWYLANKGPVNEYLSSTVQGICLALQDLLKKEQTDR